MRVCLNYNFQIPVSLIIFEAFSHNKPNVGNWDNPDLEEESNLVKVPGLEPGF